MTTWLINGASSGLGRALAIAALERGDRVAGTVRTEAALAQFEALASDRAKGFRADMADEGAVRAAVEGAIAAFGQIRSPVQRVGADHTEARATAPPGPSRGRSSSRCRGCRGGSG